MEAITKLVKASENTAKVVNEVNPSAKQAKTPKAKKKVAKAASNTIDLFITGNRRQGELNGATLRLGGKSVSLPCMASSKVDLSKIDDCNPLISGLFTELSKVNSGYRIGYKNVSRFSMGLNPISNHSHRLVIGHYHADGTNSLIVKPFIHTNEANLQALNKQGLTGAWIDPKGFIRLFVTSEKDITGLVAFAKGNI